MDSDEEISLDYEEERNSYNCSGDNVTTEAAAAVEEEYCSHHSKKDYTVLKEEMIKQLQENDISEVFSVLSVSRGTTCTFLLQQSWKVSSIFEDWFSDEERLHKSVEISSKEISPKPENYCKICMEMSTSRPCYPPLAAISFAQIAGGLTSRSRSTTAPVILALL
ncbi:hypothetical protein C2S52_014967 [Perilla frutescens var. hirtella]|nr:hypothetical protein C2S52_014967 [Perilla frutescens var. hirtella]